MFQLTGRPCIRYLKLVWKSHHGSDYYCTLTQVSACLRVVCTNSFCRCGAAQIRVHGITLLESLEEEMDAQSTAMDKIRHQLGVGGSPRRFAVRRALRVCGCACVCTCV